jgi:hypothetical protein
MEHHYHDLFPTRRFFDFLIPAALPVIRPRTLLCPEATEEQKAERQAEANAAAQKKRVLGVSLPVRALRALESRLFQHVSTSTTLFHRVLKRRRSLVNKQFQGYRDLHPRLEVRLKGEMADRDVVIQAVFKPNFFLNAGPLRDCSFEWSATDFPTPTEGASDVNNDDDDDDDDDDDGGGGGTPVTTLDIEKLVEGTRELVEGERAARDAAEQEAAAKKGTTTGGQKTEKNALEPDGAAALLVVPRAALQSRGRSYCIQYFVTHRPSGRTAMAETKISIAPKGMVWKGE